MSEADLDRNHEATPHKLQKARERGQVAKSAEAVSAVLWTVGVAYVYWMGWDALQDHLQSSRAILVQAGRIDGSAASLWSLIAAVVRTAMLGMLPFLVTLMVAALIANWAQTGPVLSVVPLQADFQRLNPVAGLKKLFSVRILFDAGRATAKLLLMSSVAALAILDLVPAFSHLAAMPTGMMTHGIVTIIAGVGLKFALVLCLLAVIDFAYTRREFGTNMRMSTREMHDEHKQREGDPRIRSRLRELRRSAVRRSMAARNTSTADVVLTNPTHVAVALRYTQGEMPSPQVVAKGAGALAASIRKVAARHRIPIVHNPALARELFRTLDVDQHVPPELFAQVARVLVWIFAMRDMQQGRRPA